MVCYKVSFRSSNLLVDCYCLYRDPFHSPFIVLPLQYRENRSCLYFINKQQAIQGFVRASSPCAIYFLLYYALTFYSLIYLFITLERHTRHWKLRFSNKLNTPSIRVYSFDTKLVIYSVELH